jgi:Ca2+-binding RTX toxin-like protein
MKRSKRAMLITAATLATAATGVAAITAQAQTSSSGGTWTCRSSAVRTQLLQNNPIEPLVANGSRPAAGAPEGRTNCADDEVGAGGTGAALLPGLLKADAAEALTGVDPDETSPSRQTVTASTGVATVGIPDTSPAILIKAAKSAATARCVNRVPVLSATSEVATVEIGGSPIQLDGVVQVAADLVNGLPTGAIVRIVPNEEIRTGTPGQGDASIIRRAVHVTVTLGGQFLDVVVAESKLETKDNPCTNDTPVGGTGGTSTSVTDRPTIGQPFGGGDVVALSDVRGYSDSPCRSSRFGRRVAIIGTGRADRITGSNFADRIFVFGGNDRVSGGRGNDCTEGGAGNDRLGGSIGNDYLLGGSGRDIIYGDAGADRIYGGSGRDIIAGWSGSDRIYGGSGNDKLNAGWGKDIVYGGTGNDAINLANQGPRQIADCGPGRDKVRLNVKDIARRNCERVTRLSY